MTSFPITGSGFLLVLLSEDSSVKKNVAPWSSSASAQIRPTVFANGVRDPSPIFLVAQRTPKRKHADAQDDHQCARGNHFAGGGHWRPRRECAFRVIDSIRKLFSVSKAVSGRFPSRAVQSRKTALRSFFSVSFLVCRKRTSFRPRIPYTVIVGPASSCGTWALSKSATMWGQSPRLSRQGESPTAQDLVLCGRGPRRSVFRTAKRSLRTTLT